MPLYHADIWLPEVLTKQIKPLFSLSYSVHARQAARNDRYGEIVNLPRHYIPRISKTIELESDDNYNLIKVVARQYYNEWFDLILVVNVEAKLVKTVWLNSRLDLHKTLDRTKYVGYSQT